MICIRYEAVKNCYNTLLNYSDKGKEIRGLKYLVGKLLKYCEYNEEEYVDVEDNMLANLLLIFDNELNDIKLNYVQDKIENNRYKYLNSNISFGIVCKIPGDTTLTKEGYEQGFLYFTAGSKIKNHTHTEEIEIYNRIDGNPCIFNDKSNINICEINNSHETNMVDRLAIIETFKIRKDLLDEENIQRISKILTKKM